MVPCSRRRLPTAAAVWVASLKGFAQFGGRVVEIYFGRKLRAITVARIAIGVLPISFVLLLYAGGSFQAILAFTLLMGASQGVITIVRGALPLALFGATGYGSVLGLLATRSRRQSGRPGVRDDHRPWAAHRQVSLVAISAARSGEELMSRWYERRRGIGRRSSMASRHAALQRCPPYLAGCACRQKCCCASPGGLDAPAADSGSNAVKSKRR